jgi:hypothetical protein
MSDGSKHGPKGRSAYISTAGFEYNEVERLQYVLLSKYNIETTIQLNTREQPLLYIRVSSMKRLAKIISPYMTSDMKYKLG